MSAAPGKVTALRPELRPELWPAPRPETDAAAVIPPAPEAMLAPLLKFFDPAEVGVHRRRREQQARAAAEAMLEQARNELSDRWDELQSEAANLLQPRPVSVLHRLDATRGAHDLLRAAADAILGFDAHGRIFDCNPATARLFETTEADLRGTPLDHWLPGFVLPALAAADGIHEAPARTAAGREFVVEIALSAAEHGSDRLGAAVLRDVTERRRYQDELRRLNASLTTQVQETQAALARLRETQQQLVMAEKLASLGALVAGVAHEINTPLGIAVTAASHLAERTQDFTAAADSGALKRSQLAAYTQTCSQSSQIILGNLERAAELIASFKRVAVDQSADEARTIVFADYLHEVLTSLQPRLRGTGVQATLDCDPTLAVNTWPGAWSQIVTNLVLNTLDHAFPDRAGGRVRIIVRRCGERLKLSVSDDGVGIPAEILDRVFDPFFTTRRGFGGSGLGLHIVFNLVHQKLGGNVGVRNGTQSGAEFFIDCPLQRSTP